MTALKSRSVKTQNTRGLVTTFEPSEAPTGSLNPTGSVVDEDKVICERLRRYFSEFAVMYIQQEVRHTGKSLGTVVEEVLRDRVSVVRGERCRRR